MCPPIRPFKLEGSLPFRFENFGTFGGPQHSSTNYDYDKASQEGTWTELLAGDYSFKNGGRSQIAAQWQ